MRKLLKKDTITVKKSCKNFVVVHWKTFTYTIFPRRGHVNATGIRDFSTIEKSVSCFNELCGSHVNFHKIKIGNSTLSALIKTCAFFPLVRIASQTHFTHHFVVSFRPDFFPGVVFRRKNQEKGTNILFSSGKIVTVGCVREEEAKNIQEILCALIHQMLMSTTSTLET